MYHIVVIALTTAIILASVITELTGQALSGLSGVEDVFQRDEYIRERIKNTRFLIDNQSKSEYILDNVLTFIPNYVDFKLRGNVHYEPIALARSEDLNRQRESLASQQYPTFKKQIYTIMDRLDNDNPEIALIFADAMLGQTIEMVGRGNTAQVVGIMAWTCLLWFVVSKI
jgi:hypothetical protein